MNEIICLILIKPYFVHAVAQPMKQALLMADHNDADGPALANVQKRVPNLRLCNGIQHGGHLVGNNISGIRMERANDAKTLLLASRQLKRPAVQPLLTDFKSLENFWGGGIGFVQNILHPPLWIDRLFRMLINQLHRAKSAPRKRLPVQHYAAGARRNITGEHSGQRGFAASAVARQSQYFTRYNRDVYVLQYPVIFPIIIAQILSN